MTAEEYQNGLRTCALAANLLEAVEIPKFLEMIERADSIGGMIDPTLYRDKHGAMMKDKELLKAARPLRDWLIALRAEVAPATPEPKVWVQPLPANWDERPKGCYSPHPESRAICQLKEGDGHKTHKRAHPNGVELECWGVK